MSEPHCACAEQTRTDLRLLRVLAHGPSGVVLPAGVVLVNIQPHFLEYCLTCNVIRTHCLEIMYASVDCELLHKIGKIRNCYVHMKANVQLRGAKTCRNNQK